MKPVLKTTITIAATAAVTFAATSVMYSINGTNSGNAQNSDFFGTEIYNKLKTVETYIDKNYLYDDIDKEELAEYAVKGYVEGLNEPYTHYYTQNEFESYIGSVEEQDYVGIGVVISVDESVGKIIIIAPTESSPAHEAGILPGDYILAVDDEAFTGKTMNECVTKIKSGKEGTVVKITVERNGERKDFNVTRKRIVSESVKSEMLDNNVGYVRITSFNTDNGSTKSTTATEFIEQVEQLKKDGMAKMIIDLRDNPGGVLDVVCEIADYILPEGVITYTETRTGKREEYTSDKNELNIPIVVLINGNSASASEVLTGALRDYGKAKVVGEKSYGKGIVQSVFPFSDGSGMSMTIAKYYSPKGNCIHGIGIEPDYTVSLPKEYKNGYASDTPRDKDTQLIKALEVLEEK